MDTLPLFLVPFADNIILPSFYTEVIFILDVKVCFLDAAEKYLVFASTLFVCVVFMLYFYAGL